MGLEHEREEGEEGNMRQRIKEKGGYEVRAENRE